MQWLVLSWALTVGYLPTNVQFLDSAPNMSIENQWIYLENNGSMETTIGLSAIAFDHIKLSTSIETYIHTTDSILSYWPYRSDYNIGLSIYTKNLELGIKHTCIHPTIYSIDQILGYGANTTEIFVKLSGETRF